MLTIQNVIELLMKAPKSYIELPFFLLTCTTLSWIADRKSLFCKKFQFIEDTYSINSIEMLPVRSMYTLLTIGELD
jgi:hypothetical protein